MKFNEQHIKVHKVKRYCDQYHKYGWFNGYAFGGAQFFAKHELEPNPRHPKRNFALWSLLGWLVALGACVGIGFLWLKPIGILAVVSHPVVIAVACAVTILVASAVALNAILTQRGTATRKSLPKLRFALVTTLGLLGSLAALGLISSQVIGGSSWWLNPIALTVAITLTVAAIIGVLTNSILAHDPKYRGMSNGGIISLTIAAWCVSMALLIGVGMSIMQTPHLLSLFANPLIPTIAIIAGVLTLGMVVFSAVISFKRTSPQPRFKAIDHSSRFSKLSKRGKTIQTTEQKEKIQKKQEKDMETAEENEYFRKLTQAEAYKTLVVYYAGTYNYDVTSKDTKHRAEKIYKILSGDLGECKPMMSREELKNRFGPRDKAIMLIARDLARVATIIYSMRRKQDYIIRNRGGIWYRKGILLTGGGLILVGLGALAHGAGWLKWWYPGGIENFFQLPGFLWSVLVVVAAITLWMGFLKLCGWRTDYLKGQYRGQIQGAGFTFKSKWVSRQYEVDKYFTWAVSSRSNVKKRHLDGPRTAGSATVSTWVEEHLGGLYQSSVSYAAREWKKPDAKARCRARILAALKLPPVLLKKTSVPVLTLQEQESKDWLQGHKQAHTDAINAELMTHKQPSGFFNRARHATNKYGFFTAFYRKGRKLCGLPVDHIKTTASYVKRPPELSAEQKRLNSAPTYQDRALLDLQEQQGNMMKGEQSQKALNELVDEVEAMVTEEPTSGSGKFLKWAIGLAVGLVVSLGILYVIMHFAIKPELVFSALLLYPTMDVIALGLVCLAVVSAVSAYLYCARKNGRWEQNKSPRAVIQGGLILVGALLELTLFSVSSSYFSVPLRHFFANPVCLGIFVGILAVMIIASICLHVLWPKMSEDQGEKSKSLSELEGRTNHFQDECDRIDRLMKAEEKAASQEDSQDERAVTKEQDDGNLNSEAGETSHGASVMTDSNQISVGQQGGGTSGRHANPEAALQNKSCKKGNLVTRARRKISKHGPLKALGLKLGLIKKPPASVATKDNQPCVTATSLSDARHTASSPWRREQQNKGADQDDNNQTDYSDPVVELLL